jgi:hypothetical protein
MKSLPNSLVTAGMTTATGDEVPVPSSTKVVGAGSSSRFQSVHTEEWRFRR